MSIVAGLSLGFAFLARQRALADPLIDLHLFRDLAFSAALAIYMFATFIAFGVYVFIAQYLQLVLGLSPLQAGLWTLPWAFSFIVGSNLTPPIARRVSPVFLLTSGLVLSAVGFAIITQVQGALALTIVVVGSVVYSLGLAPVFTLANDMIIGAAPPERAGSAAGISETCSELGGALGIAILGSIGTIIYRGQLTSFADRPFPAAATAAARDTLGGALAAARSLPDPLATELLTSAREAFFPIADRDSRYLRCRCLGDSCRVVSLPPSSWHITQSRGRPS